uniref:Uncharacterized protein n=1 Tax=Daphnia galeata TaxID=27404 RepID=A0A8J2RC79_9CRUS|nr:unnamed protein product [Daphnia galeata]
MKVCFFFLVIFLGIFTILAAVPLPQQQQGNDPFSSISGTFNQMAANTFNSAASQQASNQQAHQQSSWLWPGAGSAAGATGSSGRGHRGSSVRTTGTGWQHASTSTSGSGSVSASASAHSSSHDNQQRHRNAGITTNRPTRRTTRQPRTRNNNRN